jgi:signal transduction histidine kinase
MTNRPWQIWLLYALGLAGVAAAFAWLTAKALELDRAQSLAQRQAELEEDITAALWRMDSILTPLLAEEAARPDYVYRALYPAERPSSKDAKAEPDRELSPLLVDPPEFALLNFEFDSSGRLTSPQNPLGNDRQAAIARGITAERIDAAANRLAELRQAISYAALLAELPAQSLSSRALVHEGPGQPQSQALNAPALVNPYDEATQQQFKYFNSAINPQSNAAPQMIGPPPQPQPDDNLPRVSAPNAPPSMPGQGDNTLNFGNQLGNNQVESGRLLRSQTRAGSDLAKRDAALQSYAQKAYTEQRSLPNAAPLGASPLTVRVVEGVSRPLWMGERLLVARRVQTGDETVIQGCWLDWPRLQIRLKEEVADLLPSVEFAPVFSTSPIKLSRLLASLPVQLVVPPPAVPAPAWTPIRISLLVAWACLLVTAALAAAMLHSVITLSERRGAFVSAVTHELRTPLTTFRMYAEMLSEGMVPDAAQRQEYLETLRIEADRLAHLVENVLQYARLERGRPGKRREQASLVQLLDRCNTRLADRAEQAGMKLEVQLVQRDHGLTVATDPAAVEQILFNLVDNACKYAAQAADKRIHIEAKSEPRCAQIVVRDHGPGIAAAGRKKLFRPFSKSVHEAASTAPGVGLGLALSRRLAAELGGRLEMQSPDDGGAAFVLTLPR